MSVINSDIYIILIYFDSALDSFNYNNLLSTERVDIVGSFNLKVGIDFQKYISLFFYNNPSNK